MNKERDIDNTFNQMVDFNDRLIDSSLRNFEANTSKKKAVKTESGCPFTIKSINDPLKTRFDFHYDIGIILHPYNYFFDTLNYTNSQLKASKKIFSMPKHLRNTLFIRHDKIKEVRRMEFSTIFIIAEEMKDKTNDAYNKEQYQEALDQYNVIYSLYKWVELTDKGKEDSIFKSNTVYDISSNPLIDSDISIKLCRVNNKIQYEDETFRSGLAFVLKAMSYCYIHLQVYSEAIKCLNEALEYCDDSKPDVYFRRAQARMYNKYSTREELRLALEDLKKAIERKKGEKMIDDHYIILKELIKTKSEMDMNIIKKLISNFSYAYARIKKKNLDVNQTYQKNYDMNHLNYKIMKEIEESYHFPLRHYKKANNKPAYDKGIKEFEAFLDGFNHYKQFYELDITKLPKWQFDLLTENEKEDLALVLSSPQLLGLFNDFKYKKCDQVYMNIQFNQSLWEKCFNIVNEREKNSDSAIAPSRNLFLNFFQFIVGFFQIKSSFQFYIGSFILMLFSIFIIVPQIYPQTK